MAQTTYNTAERTAKLVPPVVKIEDKDYRVRRTGTALKAIIELSPEIADEKNPPTAADNIDLLYKGLSLLLLDPETKEHPDPDFLEDVLDFQVAQELMDQLVPRAEENPPPPVSEEAPSTAT